MTAATLLTGALHTGASAQPTARDLRGAAPVVPLAAEPPAKLVVDPPLPESLAQGRVVIQYRTENLRILPVFGPAALDVSPRIGHLHITVDEGPWRWVDASNEPLIINLLPPGEHRVKVEMVNPNHQVIEARPSASLCPSGSKLPVRPTTSATVSAKSLRPMFLSKGHMNLAGTAAPAALSPRGSFRRYVHETAPGEPGIGLASTRHPHGNTRLVPCCRHLSPSFTHRSMETVRSISLQTHLDYRQVDLALEGSQQAYGVLFKRYWKQVLFTVNKIVPDREEARDVAMEAFSKVFFNLHRFRKDYSFNTWLYRVAINHSLDYVRRKRLPTTPLSSFLMEDAYEFVSWGNEGDFFNSNPEEQIMERQERLAIEAQVGELPEKLREIARLRFVESYAYEEIAQVLALPIGTVKARIHRSRILLKRALLPLRSQL